jgi:hypothetical protein
VTPFQIGPSPLHLLSPLPRHISTGFDDINYSNFSQTHDTFTFDRRLYPVCTLATTSKFGTIANLASRRGADLVVDLALCQKLIHSVIIFLVCVVSRKSLSSRLADQSAGAS